MRSLRIPARAAVLAAAVVAALAALALRPTAPAAAPAITIKARTELRLGPIRKDYGGRYVVSGQLVDRFSGVGLGHEQITLQLAGRPVTTTTRADGTFEVSVVAPGGKQDVAVSFAGSDSLDPSDVRLDQVDIDKMGVDLQLTTEAVPGGVRIQVAAASAGVAVDLPITLSVGAPDVAPEELEKVADVVGNSSFVLTRVAAHGPGRRRVHATFAGDSVYAPATADATVELSSATTTTLTLSSGDVAYEDDVVATGRVVDEDGHGLARVPVALIADEHRLAQVVTGADGAFRIRVEAGAVGQGRRAVQAAAEPTEAWLRTSRSQVAFVEVAAPQPVPVAYTIAAFAITALCALGFLAARTRPWQKLRRPPPDERAAADPAVEPQGGLIPSRSCLVSTLRRPGDHGFGGVVRDAIRHRPLPGAHVKLRLSGRGLEADGGDDGTFVVEALGAGEWQVEVSRHGHCTERFTVTIPHRGELRGARVDLMPVRERIFSLYKRAAVPLLPDPALWGVWSPRQVFDHVRAARPAPALADLTDFVEERYFSLRLPDEDQLGEAERRVALAVRERA
ncbi:MAG: carboxypeptidase regulatory-like domain-containing protein [Myxococcales bacterium]|nr:carboxypeptidase regulatory-like domain-containing protein [Myxococcales bacterium]